MINYQIRHGWNFPELDLVFVFWLILVSSAKTVSIVYRMLFISTGHSKIKLRLSFTFWMNGIAFAEPSFHICHVDEVTEVVWFSLVANPYWFLYRFMKSRLIFWSRILNANNWLAILGSKASQILLLINNKIKFPLIWSFQCGLVL